MSLLNNMLEDIEQRQAPSNAQFSKQEPDCSSEKKPFRVRAIGFVCVAGCLVAGIYATHFRSVPLETSMPLVELNSDITPTAIPQKALPVREEQVLLSAPHKAESNALESVAATDVAEQPNEGVQRGVQAQLHKRAPKEAHEGVRREVQSDAPRELLALLVRAELAMEQERLTRPEGKNARHYYLSVLALAGPETDEYRKARAGLVRLERRYAALVEQAIADADLIRAESLLARMNQLGLYKDGAPQLEAALEQLQDTVQVVSTVPIDNPSNEPLPEPEKADLENTSSVMLTGSTAMAQGNSSLQVTASLETQDMALAEKAKTVLGKSGSMQVERELLQFIQQYPNALHSRIALFEYYLGAGLHREAHWVLELTPKDSVNTRRYFQAKILAKENEFSSALALLGQGGPHSSIAPVLTEKITSLSAALSQQIGDHASSYKLYSALVDSHPEQSTYWLGLAVSAQVLKHSGRAKQAFAQVVAFNDQPAQVLDYAKHQLVVLGVDKDEKVEVSQW